MPLYVLTTYKGKVIMIPVLHGAGSVVFTLSIGTPYLLTILVLKFEIVHSTTC